MTFAMVPAGITFDLFEWFFDKEFVFLRKWLWSFLLLLAALEWTVVYVACSLLYPYEGRAARVHGQAVWQTTCDDDEALPPLPQPLRPLLLSSAIDVRFELMSTIFPWLQCGVLWVYLTIVLMARFLLTITFFPYTALLVATIATLCHSALQDTEMEANNAAADNLLQIQNEE
jgi:hypothetical protein